jgi:hypothetical protein
MVRLVCDKCGRRGQYRIDRLLEQKAWAFHNRVAGGTFVLREVPAAADT